MKLATRKANRSGLGLGDKTSLELNKADDSSATKGTMQQQRRHVLLDYCVEDGVFGESVRKALEREQWRVFDPSRGKQLDVNTVIARGVQASDVCVLVASKGFVASKRESKLANLVSQKKMPIVWVKPPGQGDVTGWLGVILVDGTQASPVRKRGFGEDSGGGWGQERIAQAGNG